MREEDPPSTIGEDSRIKVSLAIVLFGAIYFAANVKLEVDATAARVDKIEISREIKGAQATKEHEKMLKWLSAIGQKLRVPEPPGP